MARIRKNSQTLCILSISVITVLVFLGTAMGEVSRSGLVAEYHFDDDSKDSSGYGNNGTIYGAIFVDGISGKALKFDGKNDYVKIPDAPSINIDDIITIEAWVQFNEGYVIQSIISKSSISQANSFVFPRFDKKNQFTFWLHNGDTWQTLNVGSVIPYMEWNHVVGTYDGSEMKIYVDGTLTGAQSASGGITTNTNPLSIGYQPGTREYFSGIIDEVRIYNRALTADEIKASYEAYQTLSPPKLTLEKSLSSSVITVSDPITITVRVDNTGGDAMNVKITDMIPQGFALISGTSTQEYIIVKTKESKTFQYILKANGSGEFVLDPATLTCQDNKGNSCSSSSNSATITVKANKQETTLPKMSGFGTVLAGIGIVFAIAFRRR